MSAFSSVADEEDIFHNVKPGTETNKTKWLIGLEVLLLL